MMEKYSKATFQGRPVRRRIQSWSIDVQGMVAMQYPKNSTEENVQREKQNWVLLQTIDMTHNLADLQVVLEYFIVADLVDAGVHPC
jgi:hypothetical protein